MADLQSNIKHLSSKIQGTLASHEGKLILRVSDPFSKPVKPR